MTSLKGKLVLVGLHPVWSIENPNVKALSTSNGKITEDNTSEERLCNLYFETSSEHKFTYFNDNPLQLMIIRNALFYRTELWKSFILWLKTLDFLYHVCNNLLNIWKHVWCSPQIFPSLNKHPDFFSILIWFWVP